MLTINLDEGLIVLVHHELSVVPRRSLRDLILAGLLDVDYCDIGTIVPRSQRGVLDECTIMQQGQLRFYLFDFFEFCCHKVRC